MKTKMIIMSLLILATMVLAGCMRSNEVICNYDGACEETETDDCPDCEDVLGRGLPLPPSEPPSITTINN